jgi:triacylglycerol lipase
MFKNATAGLLASALLVGVCTVSACTSEDAATGAPLADDTLAVEGYTATRYPIVLMPGILGFEKLLGVVEYFPGIAEAMSTGGANVFIVYGSKANSSEVRASQIIPQLDEIKAITGADRLNLVCHSQGGLEARIIATTRPDLVASVTSVGGPHQGVPLAEAVASGKLGPLPEAMLGSLAQLFTLLTDSDDPNDIHAAMVALSTSGMKLFNQRYPAALPATECGQGPAVVDGIRYYSWGGTGNLTNPIDILDPIWLLGRIFSFEPNDGLVPRCGTHLGQVVRDDYWQNHIDETNMIFGLVMPLGPRPQSLYRAQANRLMNDGV